MECETGTKMFRWGVKDDIAACTAIQAQYPTTTEEWDKVAATLNLRQKVSGRAMKERMKLIVSKFKSQENLNARRYA